MAEDILDSERVQRMRNGVDDIFKMVNLIAQSSKGTVLSLVTAITGVLRTLAYGKLNSEDIRAALALLHRQLQTSMADAGESLPEQAAIAFTKAFAVSIHNILDQLPIEQAADAPSTSDPEQSPLANATSTSELKQEAPQPLEEPNNPEEPVEVIELAVEKEAASAEPKQEEVIEEDEDESTFEMEEEGNLDAPSHSHNVNGNVNTESRQNHVLPNAEDQIEGIMEEQNAQTFDGAVQEDFDLAGNEIEGDDRTEIKDEPASEEIADSRTGETPSAIATPSNDIYTPRNRTTRRSRKPSVSDEDDDDDDAAEVQLPTPKSGFVFECEMCHEETSYPGAHISKKHLEKSLYDCPQCDYGNFDRRNIFKHIQSVHPTAADSITISNAGALKSEIRRLQLQCFPNGKKTTSRPSKARIPPKYPCKVCNLEVFETQRHIHVYARHMKDTRMFQCPLCDFSSKSYAAKVSMHIKKKHKEEFGKIKLISHEKEYEKEILEMNQKCFPGWRRNSFGYVQPRKRRGDVSSTTTHDAKSGTDSDPDSDREQETASESILVAEKIISTRRSKRLADSAQNTPTRRRRITVDEEESEQGSSKR